MTIRTLIDYNKNKVWNAHVQGTTLYTESGKVGGKMRKTEKAFADVPTAQKELTKKEWAKLKSGFVYHNIAAQTGEAIMHYYIARAYTGALPVTPMQDKLLVIEHGDNFEESLILVEQDGHLVQRIAAPKGMVQRVIYSEKHDVVFLIVDHKIFVGDLKTGTYELIIGYQKEPASFISLSENQDYLAWGSAPQIGVWDVAVRQSIFSQKLPNIHKIGGHTSTFTGAITNDKTFFVSSTKGACRVYHLDNPNKYQVEKGDFEGLRSVILADKAQKMLVVSEYYGSWQLKFFDVQASKFCDAPMKIAYSGTNLLSYDFSPSGNYFAMAQRGEMLVFDWNKKKLIQKIDLEHYVKRVEIAFVDEDKIAARTDYGCLSLYKVN